MAGDWIPMRTDLWDCPQVVRMASAMCPNVSERVRKKSEVIGAMFRVWSLFDTYSEDGKLVGYSGEMLNEIVGVEHFAENMQHIGWLVVNTDSLEMPGFDTHLGASAKRRLKDAQRKRESRSERPKSVRKRADKKRTTEEKIREEKSNTHTHPARGFESDWDRWELWHESQTGSPIDPIQRDALLMELNRRGPEKAARDIDFSIRKGAKSILDSDNDFEKKRNGRSTKKTVLDLP